MLIKKKSGVTQNSVGMQSINLRINYIFTNFIIWKKKDLSSTEDITFAMRNRQEWFNEKMAAVSPEIASEVQLSADIIARLDAILKQKNMTQKDLARKMGRSEAAISRWMSGFPNLTLKSIAEFSTALGEPMIKVTE